VPRPVGAVWEEGVASPLVGNAGRGKTDSGTPSGQTTRATAGLACPELAERSGRVALQHGQPLRDSPWHPSLEGQGAQAPCLSLQSLPGRSATARTGGRCAIHCIARRPAGRVSPNEVTCTPPKVPASAPAALDALRAPRPGLSLQLPVFEGLIEARDDSARFTLDLLCRHRYFCARFRPRQSWRTARP